MEIFPVFPPHPALPQTRVDERELRKYDCRKWSVDVVVTVVIPELEMVVARSKTDFEVHLTDKVPGVHYNSISVGQHLRVKLLGILAPIVVSAKVVPP
jgi:hypothetical protein